MTNKQMKESHYRTNTFTLRRFHTEIDISKNITATKQTKNSYFLQLILLWHTITDKQKKLVFPLFLNPLFESLFFGFIEIELYLRCWISNIELICFTNIFAMLQQLNSTYNQSILIYCVFIGTTTKWKYFWKYWSPFLSYKIIWKE